MRFGLNAPCSLVRGLWMRYILSSEPVGAFQVEGFGPEVRSKPHVAGSFFKGPPQQETPSNPACGRRKTLGMGSRSTTRSLAKRLREGWKMYLGESGYGFKGAQQRQTEQNTPKTGEPGALRRFPIRQNPPFQGVGSSSSVRWHIRLTFPY